MIESTGHIVLFTRDYLIANIKNVSPKIHVGSEFEILLPSPSHILERINFLYPDSRIIRILRDSQTRKNPSLHPPDRIASNTVKIEN